MNALLRTVNAGLLACAVVLIVSAQDVTKSVWDGVYTTGQADRGKASYASECASCHGYLLTVGEQATPLDGGEFLANWDGLKVCDLFERIRKTMPMNKPGKLSRAVNADILSFVLAVNKFPAGNTELSDKTEVLNQIRIEATKPNASDKK